MKNIKRKIVVFILLFLVVIQYSGVFAQTADMPLRRPISTESPAWIVHIDTWVWPDPEKCIELIPEDIRPYVIFNISLSVSDFVRGKYPYTIAESWLRTCAEKGVWAMIQPASGGPNNFPDKDLELYEYYYTYPNFVGWNFCEQNWGYDTFQDYLERLQLLTELIELADKYGGYLVVSNFLSNPMGVYNGVGKLKSHTPYEIACKEHQEHYVICDKFTSADAFYENESTNLGPYLSGYAGHYGIRFDLCGWGRRADAGRDFPEASGAIPVVEHFMMTGASVTDGPELTWQISILSSSNKDTGDGYRTKDWTVHPQFTNISIDVFRKIIDGTMRIPDRDEVIESTKVVYVCDEDHGAGVFSGYPSLYTGLYAMDGEKANNTNWFKKTGRYPSIPVVHKEGDYETGAFESIIRSSEYNQKFSTVEARADFMNSLFPSEYTGDIYARRMKNRWLTYNPDMDNAAAKSGTIPLKYNTCDSILVSHQWFSMGVLTESKNKLEFYLNNFCTPNAYGVREDIIQVFGSSNEPTWSYDYRGDRNAYNIQPNWDAKNKVFTLTIQHNGPIDITINCSGTATNKLTDYPAKPNIIEPQAPPLYMGPRQYEAENFDFRNINSNTQTSLKNYTAMGYVAVGPNQAASIRKKVSVLRSGKYRLDTRYSTTSAGNVSNIELVVNGARVVNPIFEKTATTSDWNINTQYINLNAGENEIVFQATKRTSATLYLDNIVISQEGSDGMYHFENDVAGNSASNLELISVHSGTLGVVSYTDSKGHQSNVLTPYSVGSTNGSGVADLNMFPSSSVDYSVVWKELDADKASKKGVLLRANKSSSYASGLKQGYLFAVEHNEDNSFKLLSYLVDAEGLKLKKSYTSEFKVAPKQARWFRASAVGNQLSFECSVDSINWFGDVMTYTDDTYTLGSTQLVWGLNSSAFSWKIDNILYLSGQMMVSHTTLDEFKYEVGSGPSDNQSFVVGGNQLLDDIIITASEGFEVSLNENSNYSSTLNLKSEKGEVPLTTIFARLKKGVGVGRYNGKIIISTSRISSRELTFTGEVYGKSSSAVYDFTNDKPSRNASTPPAMDMEIGQGNRASAGVVSYTDAGRLKSNVLKPYSSGQRNATGVIDLNRFSRKATNYSVTWKQYIANDNNDYKIGVLLRGDTINIGDANSGYVQGLMHGYLFIAHTVGSQNRSEFRIYKSTDRFNQVDMLVNAEVKTLAPKSNQPVWYRASVSGWSFVSLTLEYSLDEGATWHIGATATDSEDVFEDGATQFVWGLGSDKIDFYIDDITFYGIANSEDVNSVHEIDANLEVISEEYYSLMGHKVDNPRKHNLKGVFIRRSIMSDGSIVSKKIFIP